MAALAAKADLVISAASVRPANPAVGQKITVNYTLRNDGAALASNFTVTLLIGDLVISTSPNASVVGGGSFNGSFSSIWTCVAGRHVALVSSDRDNRIDESKENNNEFSAAIVCRSPSS